VTGDSGEEVEGEDDGCGGKKIKKEVRLKVNCRLSLEERGISEKR